MKEKLLLWVSVGLILIGMIGIYWTIHEWTIYEREHQRIKIDPANGLAIPVLNHNTVQ